MTLLLDLTFIPKVSRLVTNQGLEETQRQEETQHTTETTGSTVQYNIYSNDIPAESLPISELKDQLKGSVEDKKDNLLCHPSRL